MEKEFIPYQQALALKELGFDEPCLGYYASKDFYLFIRKVDPNIPNGFVLAPLYRQCWRWFREKYGVLHDIDFGLGWGYGFIPIGTELKLPTTFTEGFNTYEKAELECLKKLIEIVKNK